MQKNKTIRISAQQLRSIAREACTLSAAQLRQVTGAGVSTPKCTLEGDTIVCRK